MVIVVVEVVVVLDGINVEVVQVDVADLLLFQKEVSHEGLCHAPFRAPALVHIEPEKCHSPILLSNKSLYKVMDIR